MSMIKDQERNIEKLITDSLNQKKLELAVMSIDSLLFTDYVVRNSPQNIQEAVRFHMKAKYADKLNMPDDKINMTEIKDSVHRDIESGRFNMRFFYPDTRDTVPFDEIIRDYSLELKEQGVLMAGMDAEKTRGLTMVAYFAQHVVGDITDYDKIQNTVHRNITSSIPGIHQGQSITPTDLLRIDADDKEDEPLALLSNSHLIKMLTERQFVYNDDIRNAAKRVRMDHKNDMEARLFPSP